ncbi:MAG: hypothetical protein B7Z73_00300 [Planctomycetia bacterium 21-64-5]|nr:MAG: hypothetical protein B7Z73_00300 [Planctomycetia bacterium 21-64-5]
MAPTVGCVTGSRPSATSCAQSAAGINPISSLASGSPGAAVGGGATLGIAARRVKSLRSPYAFVLTGTPNVYGSVFRFEGQASVFAARRPALSEPGESRGPCYRCLHPEPPPPGDGGLPQAGENRFVRARQTPAIAALADMIGQIVGRRNRPALVEHLVQTALKIFTPHRFVPPRHHAAANGQPTRGERDGPTS